MGFRWKLDEYLEKIAIIHNNKYDYSLITEVKAMEKVKIICPIHGMFEQFAKNHLKGKGCAKCGNLKRSLFETGDIYSEFIERANEIHNFKYDYSKIVINNPTDKLTIICHNHGEFYQEAHVHILHKQGCKKCGDEGNRLTTEEFIQKAKEIHDDLYDYSKSVYTTGRNKILITCPKHGDFWQVAKTHLRGCRCPKCASKKRGQDFSKRASLNPYGVLYLGKQEWINMGKGKEGILYIIKCFNENESFYKLGITFNSVKQRYYGSNMPYNYEIIEEFKSKDLGYIWDFEKYLKGKILLENIKYLPNIVFNGCYTECFKNLEIIQKWKNGFLT